MQNKSSLKTVLSVIIIILLVVGLIYFFSSNSKKREGSPLQEKNVSAITQASKNDYKLVSLKGLEYGTGDQQFILQTEQGSSGPSLADVDNSGTAVIINSASDVKILNSSGELKTIANDMYPTNATIDDNGNVYVLTDNQPSRPALVKYSAGGKISLPINSTFLKSFVRGNENLFKPVIYNDYLYLVRIGQQVSYKIAPIDNLNNINSANFEKFDGIYGITGERFSTKINSKDNNVSLNVISKDNTKKTFTFNVNNPAGFFFIGEDLAGNAYTNVQIYKSQSPLKVSSEIYKIDVNGNIVSKIQLPEIYYGYSSNLLEVDASGNIWNLNPQKDKAYLEKYIGQ